MMVPRLNVNTQAMPFEISGADKSPLAILVLADMRLESVVIMCLQVLLVIV